MRERLKSLGDDFVRLDNYLQDCSDAALRDFCEKHPSLLYFSYSGHYSNYFEIDKNLFYCSRALWSMHVMIYLIKKKDKELTPAAEDVLRRLFPGISGENFESLVKKIIEAHGLNSEQGEKRQELVCNKVRSLMHTLSVTKERKEILLRVGKKSKTFWMEKSLRKLFQSVKKYVSQDIENRLPSFSFPKEITEEYSGKIYEGEEGKRKIMKAIFREVFVEFEKDLRSVHKDVLKHWESGKYFWEKPRVQVLLITVAVLSAISSLLTIGKWLWPGAP